MSGELKPNSHQNIKMTLISSRYPTHFDGEIQCLIDWESGDGDANKQDLKSIHTNTQASESSEALFLRLKKRSKIVSNTFPNNLFRQRCNLELKTERVRP